MKTPHKIIFFDGHCNLCNGSVDFLIKRDRQKKFKYASLQSAFAKDVLKTDSVDSFVFLQNGNTYFRSQAACHVLLNLGGFYKVLGGALQWVPSFLLDILYNWVAKNRFRFFGKKETCRLPTPDERDLFIETSTDLNP